MYPLKNYHFSPVITITGIFFTALGGVFLHFLYAWSGYSIWTASFCAVNESTWEHLKLLFIPVTFFTIIEYFIQGFHLPGFSFARALSLCAGLIFIVTVFYTYSGILGKNYPVVDIFIFIVSVMLTYILTIFIQKKRKEKNVRCISALIIFVILSVAFFCFTFYPPHIPLFQDPVTKNYGLPFFIF